MGKLWHFFTSSGVLASRVRMVSIVGKTRRLPVTLALTAAFAFNCVPLSLLAQSANQVTQNVAAAQVQVLPHHLPAWANRANNAGAMPATEPMGQLTMVLSRSPEQEAAFNKLLADQQNPASADYHHWLTPEQVGERFGLSSHDIEGVTSWLESQRLHVNWVSPSRTFIGFGGAAEDVGRAFHTEIHYYRVNGEQRFSVSSDPMIPKALAPVIKAIRGLYTIDEKPLSHGGVAHGASPEYTYNPGVYYVVPEDFATIYDLPSNLTGTGVTIGIVGRSRVDSADLSNFRALTGSTFSDPTEIVPTKYGGVDPGQPYTTPQGSNVDTGDQLEATLDVTRAGSVAPGANLELVVSSSTSPGTGGAIGDDAMYLVSTTPLVQIITISFGVCESEAGLNIFNFWDPIFRTAASEGISVFVASGDAGASGCDPYNATPPASPQPNSPNVICASSFVTCVGGTEFDDAANPSQYWGSNDANLGSALRYIPEGGWNEPGTSPDFQASSSGGGVSVFNTPTPSWQTGTGVPSPGTGRYTPDLAFSSAGHDGYFMCFAAGGGSCVPASEFEYAYGTSAASPDMAGITALLDEQMGGTTGQGSFNPQLYQLASSTPSPFHDATIATSGVTSCSLSTPSMCNNSIPSPTALTGTTEQNGFLLQTGYDEVTGLGSLDVSAFITAYAGTTAPGFAISGTAVSFTAGATTGNTSTITVTPSNAFTGTVAFTCAITTAPMSATSPITCTPPSSVDVTGTTAVTTTTPLTVASTATTTAGAYAVTLTGTSGSLTETKVVNVTVTGAVPGSYALTSTALTIDSPGSSGISTITVTPSNGFTGIVTFTCALATSPSNANPNYSPGCLPEPSVSITGASPQTLTVTISTFAPTTGKNEMKNLLWPSAGGATLALLLFFGLPRRRRNWLAMLGLLVVFAAFAGLGCGGGGGGGGGSGTPGTTPGTYTFTVTGSSGSLSQNTTVSMTLN